MGDDFVADVVLWVDRCMAMDEGCRHCLVGSDVWEAMALESGERRAGVDEDRVVANAKSPYGPGDYGAGDWVATREPHAVR